MSKDNLILYNDLGKTFSLAFNRLVLYSADHPLSREILVQLFGQFDLLLKEHLEILVARGPHNGEIFINQKPLDSRALGLSEIYEKFKNFQLEVVSLKQGLTYEEVVNFIKAMATPPGEGNQLVLLPDFFKKGSEHIKFQKGRYEETEKDSLEKDQNGASSSTFAISEAILPNT